VQPHPIETNLWAMHRDFARVPAAQVHDDADLLWFMVPETNSWLNGASWCNLGPDADARIVQVVETGHHLGMPLKWHVTPSCGPSDLSRRLADHGFEAESDPGMAMSTEAAFPDPPPELVVKEVTDDQAILDWVNTFDVSFGREPRGSAHPWLTPWTHLALGAGSPCRLFIGQVDGTPTAVSLAFVDGGTVGLYGVGTVPQQRGKGYGAALTVAGMLWGRTHGARTAVLEASELGRPVYERLGFRTAFEVTTWSLEPPAPGA
jgi:GNAT superfamily N-acetyltransferase